MFLSRNNCIFKFDLFGHLIKWSKEDLEIAVEVVKKENQRPQLRQSEQQRKNKEICKKNCFPNNLVRTVLIGYVTFVLLAVFRSYECNEEKFLFCI